MPSEAKTGLSYHHLGRRSEIDIIANILTEAKKGIRKTPIMYKCNLNNKQLEIYLSFLLKIGLLDSYLDERNKKRFFKTASKGSKFLSTYSKLKALML